MADDGRPRALGREPPRPSPQDPSDEPTLTELAERVGIALTQGRCTLGLAESCTGGLVAKLVTDVPGSSRYFLGGFVTYSNPAKVSLLGVRTSTLERVGAVSKEVVEEMADGAAKALEADVALSITGIAGPGGESPDKPVGTVWFGLRTPNRTRSERVRFPGDRSEVRTRAAEHGLRMLLATVGPADEDR